MKTVLSGHLGCPLLPSLVCHLTSEASLVTCALGAHRLCGGGKIADTSPPPRSKEARPPGWTLDLKNKRSAGL